MVYITGDTHGDFSRFKAKQLSANNLNLTKEDSVIICGDFGGIWFPQGSELRASDEGKLDWLAAQPWTTYFIDGNHENFEELSKYPIEERADGGKVQHIRRNKVIHLMRGQVYIIENNVIFTMGGAMSHDKALRAEGFDWWKQEEPKCSEFSEALDNIAKANYKVDYVITHCSSTSDAKKILNNLWREEEDRSINKFFEFLQKEIYFKQWYFGHYHYDKNLNNRHTCLYKNIIPIGTRMK